MTSRERVLTAFEHLEPDRVPTWCGASPEFWAKAKRRLNLDDKGLRIRFADDFRRVYSRYNGPDFKLPPDATSCTPFGVGHAGIGYGQPTSHPLANASIKDVHEYPWPDPKWWDASHIHAEAAQYQRQYAILGGDWSPFWHDLIDLLGMESLFLQMYDQPELVDAVLTHLVDFYCEVSQRIFDAAADVIDIFFIGNDLGTQTGPMLGLDLFNRFVAPHLQRFADLGHSYGLKVMLHCCGGFAELIDPMIKAGIDGLHSIQPCCRGMDLKKLKAKYGDRILFNGAIDSQRILIEGTEKFVRTKTREVLSVMMPGGGYIAGASHDCILEETPLENVLAMFDTIKEFGIYDR